MYLKFNHQEHSIFHPHKKHHKHFFITFVPLYMIVQWLKIRAINRRIRKIQLLHQQKIWEMIQEHPEAITIERIASEQKAIARMELYKTEE